MEVDNYDSENVHETEDIIRERNTETIVVDNNEQSQNIQPEVSQGDQSLPSTSIFSTADNTSTDKDSNNSFNQRNTAEFTSLSKKKASKRKIIDEHKKHSDEAYTIMKNLENKQHRDKFTVFGEHVAYKMRMLRTENAQNIVEHIVCNTLWEASMGKYDQPSFGLYNVPPILPSKALQTLLPLHSPVPSNASHYSEGTSYSESPSPLQANTNASIPDNSTTEPNTKWTQSNNIIYEAMQDIIN
ncbi:unnamed protein product [Lasius platythorax]|uniref:Uncharacterized protein n=1 Tax=Lasius platythorax TaxID=488582 RepID=A0AAV2MWD9_9HYME